ncbi:hypothetical protein BHM03_00021878 [Ensete ventricosum]|nr:hypothetical protein BHM03_00021878 [Ensete ventricosum]
MCKFKNRLRSILLRKRKHEAIAVDEGGEIEAGEAKGEGERKLDHHIVGVASWDSREDEVGVGCDEYTQEEEEGLGDHYVPIVGLVDTHPPKVGLEALELVVNVGEIACI